MPFENKWAQMSGEADAHDGVGEKPPNNFVAQLHGSEGVITINLTEEDRSIFKQFRQVKVLDQVQGTNPRVKALRAWAFTNLHESLHNFAQVGNGFFETTFSTEAGSKHTFEISFNYEGVNAVFWTLNLGFSLNKEESVALLYYPL